MINKQIVFLFASVSLTTFVAGCAGTRPASLDRARSSLTQAQQDPAVVRYAPAQLSEAQQMMTQAENAWNNEGDREEASHLSYLTEQKAGNAVAVAREKAAEDETQRLRAQREDIRVNARTREAELARTQAEVATDRAVAATTRAQVLEQELAALKAKDTERGLVMTLQEDVLFEYDKADLKPGAMRSLEPLMTFLREHPDRSLLIEGHTDSTGSDSYNLELSQRRAEAVRNFLSSYGISADRILARGYGESYPVTTNTTEAGRQQNRRVEVVIAHQGQRVAERR
jgi:outer membrane protein OmpA-like peptidoglycan-associated protein